MFTVGWTCVGRCKQASDFDSGLLACVALYEYLVGYLDVCKK